jgi:phosphoglycerate dehydrogenase-like enzyme
MRVIATKRNPETLPEFDEVLAVSALSQVLSQADFVVLACPLTSETRGLIGQAELAQMKKTAYLINVARGPIIVTKDLITALEEGHIAGAALDVFDQEPLPEDSPLWTTANLVLTPHISFSSPHTITRVLEEFAGNLTRYLAGQPLRNLMRSRTLGY